MEERPQESGTLVSGSAAPAFTYPWYAEMVGRFRDRSYAFASFPEAEALLRAERRFVLMRHDIDLDLEKALAIAELEASLSISSTFFFLMRTEHYNLFSREGSDIVSRILGLGHRLGLHFDCAAYPAPLDRVELSRACAREARMLQDWFGASVDVVSFHRPDESVLAGDALSSSLQLHTYLPLFTQEICYRADSRGAWRFGEPAESEAFRQGRPMHVLVHPIWWNEEPSPPRKSLDRFVQRRRQALERSVARNCTVYRVEDVGHQNGWIAGGDP